uniref:SH2 domain-containing protein n=1 Tax=Clytia hemisphaerica TaxID=252671 RepID=A0A7M5XKG5_9CNID
MCECCILSLQNTKTNCPLIKEVLKILRKPNKHWWLAVNQNYSMQGLAGLVPTNYVKEIQDVVSEKVEGFGTDNSNPDIVPTDEDNYILMAKQGTGSNDEPDKVLNFEMKYSTWEVTLLTSVGSGMENRSSQNNKKQDQIFHEGHTFDYGKTEDQVQITLSNPKELILTHDSYIKTVNDMEALKTFEGSNIHPYIYVDNRLLNLSIAFWGPVTCDKEMEVSFASRKDAEIVLSGEREGSFLLRESESSPGDLTLSMRRGEKIIHVWIGKSEEQFIYSEPRRFESIEEIIEVYHRSNLVSKRGQTIRLWRSAEKKHITDDYNSFEKKSYGMVKMSQEACEDKLIDSVKGAFLVRKIDKEFEEEKKWILSVKFHLHVEHFLIELNKEFPTHKFVFGEYSSNGNIHEVVQRLLQEPVTDFIPSERRH